MTLNVTTVITVNGTNKSERGVGLESGESNQFTIMPGECDRLLNSVDDLISQIERSAYLRGEWISSFCIDGADLVSQQIADALRVSHGNVEEALEVLCDMPMFCNAGGDDLRALVMQIASAQSGA